MKPKAFNAKVIALALCVATAAGIALFPVLQKAQAIQTVKHVVPQQSHRIEVVFILDTTSSMSGLIRAAKEKIWSIASTMASAQENPDIKMGLVAFRDRGDTYVTRVFDLSSDLDTMYAQLMDFRAEGGGDAHAGAAILRPAVEHHRVGPQLGAGQLDRLGQAGRGVALEAHDRVSLAAPLRPAPGS